MVIMLIIFEVGANGDVATVVNGDHEKKMASSKVESESKYIRLIF